MSSYDSSATAQLHQTSPYRSGTALLEPVPPPTLIDPASDDPYERRRELARRVVAAFQEDDGALPYGVAILWRRRRDSEAVAA